MTEETGVEQIIRRDVVIIRASAVGIITNIFLSAFKAVVGIVSHSIAVTLDAVNNLSDALSSVITIIGTRLSKKSPDKKHPFGHGRVEYLTTAVIALIVLYAGLTALIESAKKIISPQTPDYSVTAVIIIAVAAFVKIALGLYLRTAGKRVRAESLVASGTDSLFDSIISFSTLAAVIVFRVFGLSLESYLGVVISAVIIKSGIGMLRETMSKIIGERADGELTKNIKQDVAAFEGVNGAFDLLLNDYGPDTLLGAVHIEIPDYYTAGQIDVLTRKIQAAIYEKYHVFLATIGIYSTATGGDAIVLETEIRKVVMAHQYVLQVHGFYIDFAAKKISFDVVLDFEDKNRQKTYAQILESVRNLYPGYEFSIAQDSDISD